MDDIEQVKSEYSDLVTHIKGKNIKGLHEGSQAILVNSIVIIISLISVLALFTFHFVGASFGIINFTYNSLISVAKSIGSTSAAATPYALYILYALIVLGLVGIFYKQGYKIIAAIEGVLLLAFVIVLFQTHSAIVSLGSALFSGSGSADTGASQFGSLLAFGLGYYLPFILGIIGILAIIYVAFLMNRPRTIVAHAPEVQVQPHEAATPAQPVAQPQPEQPTAPVQPTAAEPQTTPAQPAASQAYVPVDQPTDASTPEK